MKNRIWLIYGIGLLALALLFIATIPFYGKRIPEVLGETTRASLLQKGFDWVAIQFSGRDATLSGKAPNADAHDEVLETVQAMPGVREVIDHMTPRIVSPYTANIEWRDGQLALTGFIPDQASYQVVNDTLERLYGDSGGVSETSGLQLANGEPGNWTPLLINLLENIHQLDRAQADLVDQQLHLSGITHSSTVRESVLNALGGLAQQGFVLDLHIVATDTAARICQQQFNQLLQTPVLFESGSARVNPRSLPLLDKLAETALLCPGAKITIAGHTDNLGSPASNLKLSEQRATAVVSHLFNAGLETDRIRAVGYGATRPRADNGTQAGREKNRRIEFIVEEN